MEKYHGMKKRSEPDFRMLFESVPGLYLILDPELVIIAVSQSYMAATMTKREEISGKHLFTVFPDNPDDPNATGVSNLRDSLQFVLNHKTAHTMAVQKYDIRRPDGSFEERFWSPVNKPILDEHANIVYIIHRVEDVTEFMRAKNESAIEKQQLRGIASSKDQEIYQRAREIQALNQKLLAEIEERKEAEEKLRTVQILLQCTLESHKEILIFTIDRNYCYLNFNSAFRAGTIHAYGTDVRVGMSIFDSVTSGEDRERVKTHCDRALTGEGHISIEAFGTTHRSYFETRYNPVYNDKQEIIGVTVLSANVTSRIEKEEEIKALNKELEAFSYSVAHDLRAPLRIIDGYSEMITEDYGHCLDDEGKRLLGVITGNARHMGQLIDDLLNFSRLGRLSVNRKLADIDSLVRYIIDEQLSMAPPQKVDFKIGTIEPAHCDAGLMRYVFANLISNAIKYSRKKERSIIEVGSDLRPTEVVYFIRDNGSGFDMRYSDKLFTVFQRLHKISDFEGTGVGLAIVHRIVSKHGGRVWAEGEVDKGATFFVSLPLAGAAENGME
jgi:signal transduction histidine kinase